MLNQLNNEVYTSVDIGGMQLPLHIHISKLKDVDYYEVPEYNCKIIEGATVVDDLDNFFYGKFQEVFQTRFIVSIIHDFIDYENMKYIKYFKSFPKDKDEFIDFIINSGIINVVQLHEIYGKILILLNYLKEEFINKVIELLDLERKYPKIALKNSIEDTPTYKKYSKDLQLPYIMITLKNIFEYNGEIMFEENIGLPSALHSWREKEMRRLYFTKKSNFDDFHENVKSKILEDLTPSYDSDK